MSIEAAPFKVDTLAVSNQVCHPRVSPLQALLHGHMMGMTKRGVKRQLRCGRRLFVPCGCRAVRELCITHGVWNCEGFF